MTSNFSVVFKKYSMPVIFLIVGLGTLILGIVKEQGTMFTLAAVMMFIAGAASMIYSSGKLKTAFLYIFGVLAGIAALFTLYASYNSVKETQDYEAAYKECKELAKQNLSDVRFIQKLYAEKNGVYLKTWDELVEFVKNGKVNKVISRGVVPAVRISPEERNYLYHDNRPIDNNMTEKEAYLLSKWKEGPRYDSLFSNFVRDTVPVSLMESKFLSKSYVTTREKLGFPKFNADSLPFIPKSGGKVKWTMETKDSVLMGDMKVPALYIYGTLPYAEHKGKKNEKMHLGTLSSNSLTGSWEE